MSEQKIVLYNQLMDLRHEQSNATSPQARQRIQDMIKELLAQIDAIRDTD